MNILLGQLIGDALGARYEFLTKEDIKTQMIKDLDRYGHLPILGGGVFDLEPGQITDDSEMALTLLNRIKSQKFNIKSIADGYTEWYHSSPFDIGITIGRALYHTKIDAPDNHKIMMSNADRTSLSNGCLMRISVLPMVFYNFPLENILEMAVLDCKLTHPNRITIDAVRVFVTAIYYSRLTKDNKKAFYEAYREAKTEQIQDILAAAEHHPEPCRFNNRDFYTNSKHCGFIGIALQNAFYELLHFKDIETSLINIILRGGDTDTNACIAGALLGPYSIFPTDWKNAIRKKKNLQRYKQYPIADPSIALAI